MTLRAFEIPIWVQWFGITMFFFSWITVLYLIISIAEWFGSRTFYEVLLRGISEERLQGTKESPARNAVDVRRPAN